MINPRTLEKIRIVGADEKKVLGCLEEFIDFDQIPNTYGGGLKFNDDKTEAWKSHDYKCILSGQGEKSPSSGRASPTIKEEYDGDDCRWFSDDEVKFREFVYSKPHNWSARKGEDGKVEWGEERKTKV